MGIDATDQTATIAQRFARAHTVLRTAAVTGTNGKTTTTSMIEAIVAAAGEPSARLTTLGAWVCGEKITADTPTAEFLHTVERAVAQGVRTLALETTSKALAGGLAKRWQPQVAVFTNLSRDHLDMHKSAEAYLAAKAQLFLALPPDGTAVLNGDDPAAGLIAELMGQVLPRSVTVRRFSIRDEAADLAALAIETSRRGTRVTLAPSRLADAWQRCLTLRVVGDVHAQNALAATLAGSALGYPAEVIRTALEAYAGVPGRFQVIAQEPLVVVDYAHTPDGLQGTLRTARRLLADVPGRLVCVFGCGGNRDAGKRPEMGAIADALADVVILTSDNPRYEAPDAIAAQVRAGIRGPGHAAWQEELDRYSAIEQAIHLARPEDIVVIAGKGHEEEQEIQGERLPFSDAEVARQVCAAYSVSERAAATPGSVGTSKQSAR